jgi:hypothetical protein
MRHATSERLDDIEPLLEQVRSISGIVEKTRGHFYRGPRGCLHFHEDGDDLYADVRIDTDDFERVRVTTTAEQRRLVTRLRAAS